MDTGFRGHGDWILMAALSPTDPRAVGGVQPGAHTPDITVRALTKIREFEWMEFGEASIHSSRPASKDIITSGTAGYGLIPLSACQRHPSG